MRLGATVPNKTPSAVSPASSRLFGPLAATWTGIHFFRFTQRERDDDPAPHGTPLSSWSRLQRDQLAPRSRRRLRAGRAVHVPLRRPAAQGRERCRLAGQSGGDQVATAYVIPVRLRATTR